LNHRIQLILAARSPDSRGATRSGTEVGERVPIPDALVPVDASVEWLAKIAASYFTEDRVTSAGELPALRGRGVQ